MITKRVKYYIALLVLVIAALGFFKDTWVQGKLPIPTDAMVGLYHPYRDTFAEQFPRGVPFKNFLTTDPIRQQIPWRKLAVDQWKQGNIPWWNPSSFSGMPMAANIQAAVFYPLNIVFFALPFPTAWTILIILQPLMAALFMFVYLRGRSFRLASATFGSVIWAFCGFHISWLTWGTINHVTLWIPLALFCADILRKAADAPTPKGSFLKQMVSHVNVLAGPALALGGIMTLQVFAGHIQMALYSIVLIICYIIFFPADRSKHKINRVRLSIGLGTVVVSTALISAIQLIPLGLLLAQSSRVDQFLNWQKEGWFLPWQHLVQFIAPDFFGNPATLNYWGIWNYGEFIGYIGLIPFTFALSALLQARRNQFVRFWGSILGLTLLFMLPWFGSEMLYILHLPVLSVLQPTRLMVIVSLSLVVLAVYGFDEWMKLRLIPKKTVAILSLVFLLLWGFIYFSGRHASGDLLTNILVTKRNMVIPSGLFLIEIVVLIAAQFSIRLHDRKFFSGLVLVVFMLALADLYRMGWKFVPFTDPRYFYPESKAITFLQLQPKPFRIMTTDDRILAPNISGYYHLESIEGYDPLYLSRYERLIAASEKGSADVNPPYGYNRIITPRNVTSPVIPLLNVKYVLSLTEINTPNLSEVFREGTTRIYELTSTLPRAYFAATVKRVGPGEDVLAKLFLPEFTGTTAWVEENPAGLDAIPGTDDEAVILPYEGQLLHVRTKTQNSRFLVISEMHNPIWSVTIDGNPATIYRTNYAFMGIVVPAGVHDVRIRPKPGI